VVAVIQVSQPKPCMYFVTTLHVPKPRASNSFDLIILMCGVPITQLITVKFPSLLSISHFRAQVRPLALCTETPHPVFLL